MSVGHRNCNLHEEEFRVPTCRSNSLTYSLTHSLTTLSPRVGDGVVGGRVGPVALVVAHRGEVDHGRGQRADHVQEEVPHRLQES